MTLEKLDKRPFKLKDHSIPESKESEQVHEWRIVALSNQL